MLQRRLSTKFTALLLLVSLAAVILLNSPRLRQTGLQTLAEGQNTAVTPQQIYLPAVQQNNSEPLAILTPTPTVNGFSLPPGYRDTDPEHPNDPNATAETDTFFTPVPFTPVPTPDVNVTTVPELDAIAFTNFRQLVLPSQHPTFYGQVAWSPDGKHFLAVHDGTMDGLGLNVYHLYMGDVETGEFALWSANASWPVWSRDGQFIYYLATRQDGTRFTVAENLARPYYDLYRRPIAGETAELLLKDVEPPGVPGAQLAELAGGEILTFNSSHQLILLPAAAELAKITAQNATVTALTSLEALTGKLESIYVGLNILPPSFSVSRDGKMAVATSLGKPAPLLDLINRSKTTAIDGLDSATNVAWSLDNSAFAYTDRQGLLIYDIASQETRRLVTTKSLGFHPDDPRSGIGSPAWVLKGQVLLFVALNVDWIKPGTESHFETFIFSITSDGAHRRPLGYYGLESVSPDGQHAIISQPDAKTGALTTGETTLWLVDIQGQGSR